jgi:hypothetical protein
LFITPTFVLCRPRGGGAWWRPDLRLEGRHNPVFVIDTRLVGFDEEGAGGRRSVAGLCHGPA